MQRTFVQNGLVLMRLLFLQTQFSMYIRSVSVFLTMLLKKMDHNVHINGTLITLTLHLQAILELFSALDV